MKLEEAFERVVVINLPYREDRRASMVENLMTNGMIGDPSAIRWERAISGDMSPPPAWWNAGNGAWGCLMSHLRVVQDAIMDGVENYIVLEDDACTHHRAPEMLDGVIGALQSDWDMLYLGGQHRKTPEDLGDGLMRGIRVNRTHAFAVNHRFFQGFQQHIMHAPDYIDYHKRWNRGCHIDHHLERLHERRERNILCPKWWLFGQEGGSSNISGRTNPRLWWHPEIRENYESRPVVVVPEDSLRDDESVSKIHFGHNLQGDGVKDLGYERAMRSIVGLRTFLSMIARESLSYEMLPGFPCDDIDHVRKAWPNAVALGDVDYGEYLPVPRRREQGRNMNVVQHEQGDSVSLDERDDNTGKVESAA